MMMMMMSVFEGRAVTYRANPIRADDQVRGLARAVRELQLDALDAQVRHPVELLRQADHTRRYVCQQG
jgi:hypothetical protein